jgi:hypothetical protein
MHEEMIKLKNVSPERDGNRKHVRLKCVWAERILNVIWSTQLVQFGAQTTKLNTVNETLPTITCGEFLEQLSDYYVPQDSASWKQVRHYEKENRSSNTQMANKQNINCYLISKNTFLYVPFCFFTERNWLKPVFRCGSATDGLVYGNSWTASSWTPSIPCLCSRPSRRSTALRTQRQTSTLRVSKSIYSHNVENGLAYTWRKAGFC